MKNTLLEKLESAWGIVIDEDLYYIHFDWEEDDNEFSIAFIHPTDDDLRYFIPRDMEEKLEVKYNNVTAQWTITNMNIPTFQILKVDTY